MSSHPASDRPTFSPGQLEAYFDRISLPRKWRKSAAVKDTSLTKSITYGLPLLSALQLHSLASIPFENLSLHYSRTHTVSLDADSLYNKMIAPFPRTQRGGYCMENSAIFATVLRTLGYRVLSTGARVHGGMNPGGEDAYSGWSHMVNLVEFDDDNQDNSSSNDKDSNSISRDSTATRKPIFFVDVGFGSACPTRPVELTDLHLQQQKANNNSNSSSSETSEWINVPPSQLSRVWYTAIADASTSFSAKGEGQKMFVYEIRYGPHDDWKPAYCFSDLEFLPRDYAIMNYWTSTNPNSWFTQRVVCVKMLLSGGQHHHHQRQQQEQSLEEEGKEGGGGGGGGGKDAEADTYVVGDLTLSGDVIKRRINGVAETVAQLQTEEERVHGLKEWFGIDLSQEERDGIKGKGSALR